MLLEAIKSQWKLAFVKQYPSYNPDNRDARNLPMLYGITYHHYIFGNIGILLGSKGEVLKKVEVLETEINDIPEYLCMPNPGYYSQWHPTGYQVWWIPKDLHYSIGGIAKYLKLNEEAMAQYHKLNENQLA